MGSGGGRGRRAAALIAVAAALLASACSGPGGPNPSALEDDAVTVASFNFPESVLLAELYAQALEAHGFRVDRKLDLGTREIVEPALERGLVELVPEYGGSLLEFLAGQNSAGPDAEDVHHRLASALQGRGIVALDAAPAQDQNGVVVTRTTADRYGVRTISDLAPIADGLTFGGPPECRVRPLCLPGLASAYGLTFASFVPLDEGGPLTIAALQEEHVQVAVMFTSDGAIEANDLVVLTDDRHLQPAENVTPVVRQETLQRLDPQLAEIVNSVSALLTTHGLRQLNAEVSSGDRTVGEIAADWLRSHGLTGPVG
ncbi:MAG TPA: ABC transporter substrate-binding protein [Actinomycetota bacterium]